MAYRPDAVFYLVMLVGLVWLALVSTVVVAQASEADGGCNYDSVIPTLSDDGSLAETPIASAIDIAGGMPCRYDEHSNTVQRIAGVDAHRSAPRSTLDDLAGAACSFSAATTVVMADGTRKAISEIEVGDYVLAEDPETGERGPRRTTHVWEHEDTVVDLEIDGDLVTTTEDHPFWNATDSEWQEASGLETGDLVRTSDGELVEVGDLRLRTARRTRAFNLTVDGVHTYFVGVGDDDVLVHNTCNVTRTGVTRNNPADWRRTRDVWDQAGMGDILSPANRQAIARGRTPVVDDEWVSWFPGDSAMLGQRIPMHHIGGGPMTVPLPAARQLDAHMPGGFKVQPWRARCDRIAQREGPSRRSSSWPLSIVSSTTPQLWLYRRQSARSARHGTGR